MTRDNQSINRDEWLADFADQALDGDVNDLSTVGSDPEMRALAETILLLKHTFPKEDLSQATIKQMRANILEGWQKAERKRARWLNPFRPEWLSQPGRRQFAVTVTVLAVVGILIVAVPFLFTSGLLTAGAGSETPIGISAWIIVGVLVIAFLWLLRRKP